MLQVKRGINIWYLQGYFGRTVNYSRHHKLLDSSCPILLSINKHSTIVNPLLILSSCQTRLYNLPAFPTLHKLTQPLPQAILHPQRPAPYPWQHEPGSLGQNNMLTLATQHGLDNTFGNRLGIQDAPGIEAFEQSGACIVLGHEYSPYLRCVVASSKFGGETFVEGQCSGLGRGVVDHGGGSEVAGDRGDGDDHAVAVGNHARKELLGEVVVAESVDLEGQVDVLFGRLEDGLAACDTCIVDEDRGVSQCGAD